MSKSEHWDILAQQIGAEVPPETPAAEPAPAATPPVPRPAAKRAEPPPRPAKKSDWSLVASILGIGSKSEPPQQPAPPPITPAQAVELAPDDPPAQSLPVAKPLAEAAPVAAQPPELAWDLGSPAETATEADFAEYVEVELVDEVAEADADVPREGGEERPSRRRRRRRGGRRSRQSRERDATAPSAGEESAERASVEDDAEEFDEGVEIVGERRQSSEHPDGEETSEERRGRRRRRRRGRRKSESAPAAESSAAAEDNGTAAHDVDDHLLDSTDIPTGMGDEMDDDDPHLNKDSHRAIPSWEDAIGMIVAVNMEARAKSPRSGGPPRGRNRGRGRGPNRGHNGR